MSGEDKQACERLGRQVARIMAIGSAIIAMVGSLILAEVVMVGSVAKAADTSTRAALQQAQRYRVQFRLGHTEIVPEFIAAMEQATQSQPDEPDLWYALGDAYLSRAAVAIMPGGTQTDAPEAIRKGFAALNHALKLNPDHADTLARRGAMMALLGTVFQNQPKMMAAGIADMNRAVELAPKSVRVRLQRAFVGPVLPDAVRDRASEAADYDFVIPLTNGSRQGDYIRLLRGDLAFETGQLDVARVQYGAVAKSDTAAAPEARARLAALDAGSAPMDDIRKLRSAAGARCAMCHGG